MAALCVQQLQVLRIHLSALKWFTPYDAKVFFVFYFFLNASCLMGHQSKTNTYCTDLCTLHYSSSLCSCLSGFWLKHKLRFHYAYNYAKPKCHNKKTGNGNICMGKRFLRPHKVVFPDQWRCVSQKCNGNLCVLCCQKWRMGVTWIVCFKWQLHVLFGRRGDYK